MLKVGRRYERKAEKKEIVKEIKEIKADCQNSQMPVVTTPKAEECKQRKTYKIRLHVRTNAHSFIKTCDKK